MKRDTLIDDDDDSNPSHASRHQWRVLIGVQLQRMTSEKIPKSGQILKNRIPRIQHPSPSSAKAKKRDVHINQATNIQLINKITPNFR